MEDPGGPKIDNLRTPSQLGLHTDHAIYRVYSEPKGGELLAETTASSWRTWWDFSLQLPASAPPTVWIAEEWDVDEIYLVPAAPRARLDREAPTETPSPSSIAVRPVDGRKFIVDFDESMWSPLNEVSIYDATGRLLRSRFVSYGRSPVDFEADDLDGVSMTVTRYSTTGRKLPSAPILLAPEPADREFSDVVGSVHARAIGAVVSAEIAGGYSDGTYRPNDAVTRGQMATFLARALDLPLTVDAPHPDVVGSVHARAIGAVVSAEIAGGYSDGTYRPNDAVTRGQMATFLARALNLFD